MKRWMIGIAVFVVCFCCLVRLDRFFFKHNSSFCSRFIHSTLPYNPQWDILSLPEEQQQEIFQILDQKFYYLNKGNQTYSFLSEDGNFVLKFCRSPSALRPLPWISHTFAKIKSFGAYDDKRGLKKLYNSFHSYKLAYQELKEETGLIYIHLNRSSDLKKKITIVDKLGSHYRISLDQVSFLLQKRAELIYPALERYSQEKNFHCAKHSIESMLELFLCSAQKGIINHDAIMHKNYGIAKGKAIHIDVGKFGRDEKIKEAKELKNHIIAMTSSLKKRIEKSYPEFLPFYEEAKTRLLSSDLEEPVDTHFLK